MNPGDGLPACSGWFDWDEEVTEHLATYLSALRVHGSSSLEFNPVHSQVYDADVGLTLTLDVVDTRRRCVLRTLRVDCSPFQIVCGEDETHQFTTPLDPRSHSYFVSPSGSERPLAAADVVASWLRQEALRPIHLHQWQRGRRWLHEYFLADTRRSLSWGASAKGKELSGEPPTAIIPVVTTKARLRT